MQHLVDVHLYVLVTNVIIISSSVIASLCEEYTRDLIKNWACAAVRVDVKVLKVPLFTVGKDRIKAVIWVYRVRIPATAALKPSKVGWLTVCCGRWLQSTKAILVG